MKFTLNEAMQASAALASPHFPKVKGKAAYDLARWRDKLKSALKPLHEQQRDMIEEHGGKIGADGTISWPKPKDGEEAPDALYLKAWNELLESEIDIDREPVKLDAFLGPDEAKQPEIQPELLSLLEKIIVE